MPKSPRDREIKRWSRQHPSVRRYVVIDDEANELDDLPLFQPSGKTGLTAKVATMLVIGVIGLWSAMVTVIVSAFAQLLK
jgi:hypothetical protein